MYRPNVILPLKKQLKAQRNHGEGGVHTEWPILEITNFDDVWHTSACYFRTFTEIRGPVRTSSLSRRHRPFGSRPVSKIRRSESRERQEEERAQPSFFFLLFSLLLFLFKSSLELICLLLFSGSLTTWKVDKLWTFIKIYTWSKFLSPSYYN